ncbi:uncharacterized protein [Aegilops tauschii subsp. strangulata]|uniref:uncharacterized protein n=1 Tax=Aegilops tauschii subsp. strangulata TaxID=200361 RepID=UPI003CC8AE7D
MPPRCRGSSGYRGIRARPNGWYSAEIRSNDVRLGLGTFGPRTRRPAPPPPRRRGGRASHGGVAPAPPEDVANERAYSAERTSRRRAERADQHRRKALAISQCDMVEAGGRSIFTSDDERWEDIWIDTSDNTSEDEDDDEDLE